MIETKVTCDMCGATRDEKNHWFMARPEGTGLVIQKFQEYESPTFSHICGTSCVLKYVASRLEKL